MIVSSRVAIGVGLFRTHYDDIFRRLWTLIPAGGDRGVGDRSRQIPAKPSPRYGSTIGLPTSKDWHCIPAGQPVSESYAMLFSIMKPLPILPVSPVQAAPVASLDLQARIRYLYNEFGQTKKMGMPAKDDRHPHYFLYRTFLAEQDLLIIFNTKRCRYSCSFCALPYKSGATLVPSEAITDQFEFVVSEMRHCLSVIDRLTISNDGSVLDSETFPRDALLRILSCTAELRRVRTVVLESRLEFVDPSYLHCLGQANRRASIDILTGFETLDAHIRDEVLRKAEPLEVFSKGLDRVAASGASLTAYVLFKPCAAMTDAEAYSEADASIDYLVKQCHVRRLPLTVRLNPMYAAKRTSWERNAESTLAYRPPRLTDVLNLAREKRRQGIPIYIGASTECLEEEWGTYRAREDFSKEVLKAAIVFNCAVSR
jgi:radical SAM enzyme (TIGR01210 family)